jgi:hypothetical protein
MRNERRKSRATNCGLPFSIAGTLSRQFKPGNQAKTSLRMRRRWIGHSAGDAKDKCGFAAMFNIEQGLLDPPPRP